MVVGEASIHNIMGGMESTGGVRLHNHKRKLKQRFDIIKKLGQGTYGKVQLGINKETGQEVAIKTIKKCKIETEADLIRIRREIQIMSSVQHPNIIHIYEVFENREKMVLVMEYAAGGELYDYLSERKVLSEHEARRIFRQIATAVFYCHKHKICHRDLKLENILLDQVGNAKIADFGLSNVFDEQRLLNTFCGSPLYASPEIVKGTPYHGPEVDCWSLGVLLYTLVYGAMPFDGSNFKRLVKQISQSDYFEPKKPSPASPLIKDMLTVNPGKRADVEKICTHWWVNEGYEQNCLDIAEELAAQTPVRLDLLLSLVPQSASAEKLVVGDDRQGAGDVGNNVSSETRVPTRCHSVGSLMELDRNDSDRRIREMLLTDDETRSAQFPSEDAKRKLETTPSMEETAAAGVKRKERSRRKERTEEREPRTYRSGSRHHSAPIPNAITEEAMEVDPVVIVPTSDDPNGPDATTGCLELIKECNERSPSKERSKTPIPAPSSQKQEEPIADVPMDDASKTSTSDLVEEDREEKLAEENATMRCQSVGSGQTLGTPFDDRTTRAVSKSETSESRLAADEPFVGHDSVSLEATQREFKKLKEKALSLDSELSTETRDVPARTFERRRSKIFETAEKFNQMASSVETEKPKKIFIPGVNVGGAKRVFERKASLSSIGAPPPAKPSASKVIIDVPTDKRTDKSVEQSKPARETRHEEQQQREDEEEKKREDAKKRAVDIITGAIGKPPVQRRTNGSPPVSPSGHEPKKLPLKIPVGTNDLRTATVSVSTPVDTNFSFDHSSSTDKQASVSGSATTTSMNDREMDDAQPEEPRMSSKMEITLKSATLPRPRKTSKAEISLSGAKSSEPVAFRSEVAAKIDAFQPQKLRTQRSEVAFPVAAAIPHAHRSASLEPDTRHAAAAATPKERIIPIQVEGDTERDRSSQHSSTPPTPPTPVSAAPKPPMSQRLVSQRSGSLSRQSTADSDTDSALGSTVGPEPIRKSPREYIIPIAVEGGGYVTPRSGSVEPESKTSTSTSASTNASRSRFARPRRMSSLLSDASEDESPFSTLHRDSEDLLQRHMHRLRSSRPSRQPPEHADSLSSGEDDDDDGFELLTAENLFSTLLSRVRSLTQRLNVDDNRNAGFPSSRLFGRLGPNTSQTFWGLNKPLSRRLTESQFRHSLSRDGDAFSRKDSVDSNPGTTHGPNSASTRETVFDIGNNTLPRDRVEREDAEVEAEAESEPTPTPTPTPTSTLAPVTKDARESLESMEPGLEHGFTPSLAKRLSRSFIEQTRRPLPYEKPHRRSIEAPIEPTSAPTIEIDTVSDRTEYKEHRPSANRTVRRSNSLLESTSTGREASYRASPTPRRSVSLFDDDYYDYNYDFDVNESTGRERNLRTSTVPFSKPAARNYKENATATATATGKHRRENFHPYRTDKIQEETTIDDALFGPPCRSEADQLESYATDNGSVSEMPDATSSVSTKSYDTSPTTESSSNALDYSRFSAYAGKSDQSRSFENRLLAAENLIKESKLRNLGSNRFDPNLCSSYADTDKCEKQSLISISESTGSFSAVAKRRSCIPSLRFRSGSLTRDPTSTVDRRKSFADTRDLGCVAARALTPEKSILSKFFKPSGSRDTDSKQRENHKDAEREKEEKPQKSKQHRISRFLRPDFFDTPREESKYAKEKEERKAAENERRKSRFIKRKSESRTQEASGVEQEKREKELKNEINALRKDSRPQDPSEQKREKDASPATTPIVEQVDAKKIERGSRNSFLHSLEKKLERLRSNEETTSNSAKLVANGGIANESRERSAPPGDVRTDTESGSLQKAVSVEDLTASSKPVGRTSSKSKVSSVLGLFRNTDAKQTANTIGSRTQNAILGRLKKSPPKAAKSDVSVPGEDASSCANGASNGSKIPTKLSAKSEPRSTKKLFGEGKRSVAATEKPGPESPKRSPPKEKPPIAKERRGSSEKDIAKGAVAKTTDASREKLNGEAIRPPGESAEKKEETANGSNATVEKKVLKTRKNRSLAETGSSTGESTKCDDTDKKAVSPAKKVAKPSETGEGNCVDGTKKKKTTRTVKKIVKKASSDGSDDKPEDPGKPGKPRTKKKLVGPVDAVPISGKTKDNSVESQTNGKSFSTRSSLVDKSSSKSDPQESGRNGSGKSIGKPSSVSETKPNNGQSKLQESQRANRTNLKLDLSKIPQHSFRNTTPKRDSPKSDSPMITVGDSPTTSDEKLIDCLSKVTHRASITGNKIVIDKPLRAKDVAELKREVTECAKMIESHVEAENEKAAKAQQQKQTTPPFEKKDDEEEKIVAKANRMKSTDPPASEQPVTPGDRAASTVAQPWKESPTDLANDPFSPVDEPESFDSWSVSSTELNHARPDLRSPTSPSHPLYARTTDSSAAESVIDRIRRRSFYSRFNDRRRPSLTAPPPGLGLSTSAASLPRKYSFSGHREHRDRSKYGTGTGTGTATGTIAGYGLSGIGRTRQGDRCHRTRSFDLYADDAIGSRNRSLERPRYSDAAVASSPYIVESRSSIEQLPPLSSSYDPLRRYIRSPTFDLSTSRTRYHSADFSVDSDHLASYRSPFSGLSAESAIESHAIGSFGASSTLPRKYGSSAREPKTVEYYEELLAPTVGSTDFLQIGKSSISGEYLGRCENGFYNGSKEPRSSGGGSKRKPYEENANGGADLAERCEQEEERFVERTRSRSGSTSASVSISASASTSDRQNEASHLPPIFVEPTITRAAGGSDCS